MDLFEILDYYFDDYQIEEDNSIEQLVNIIETEGYKLDLWPCTVPKRFNHKYCQVEVFYQKYLDGKISKNEFRYHESKYHNFIKALWLYSDTYAYVENLNFDIIKNNKKRYGRKYTTKFKKMLLDQECVEIINDYMVLEDIMYLATHDITPITFFFIDIKVIVFLDDSFGIVYCGNNQSFELINNVATTNQLYIYK